MRVVTCGGTYPFVSHGNLSATGAELGSSSRARSWRTWRAVVTRGLGGMRAERAWLGDGVQLPELGTAW